MRILLMILVLTMLCGCVSVGDDKAKAVFELQESAERLYQQGEFSHALPKYRRLVEQLPLSTRSWLRLGNCHAQMGAYSDAVLAYQTALAIDETYASAWINLAYVQSQILSQTVASMYEQVPKTDPKAQRVQKIVDAVLEPFPSGRSATAESQGGNTKAVQPQGVEPEVSDTEPPRVKATDVAPVDAQRE
ncbi:tetratricopeptide repeat protein [Gilvimarinus agarilyticus]|uniref:tetratricopeptide repeat protein n=1 Tax=Gilvimarinus sp. 2_MG-2023 TaxID=3062666 RepID=UPI001C08A899|nr:tetratricopeptide repeat protein [Gilvimarinus sp. 2_MG-2023]MBU2885277.1 tetratricopeptide repeat protein [Gilvimarinus agarilyticus]MDO6570174.1 tetratricopeptide repeat protein [Gilvimarinus sp. 2_MG-2023]